MKLFPFDHPQSFVNGCFVAATVHPKAPEKRLVQDNTQHAERLIRTGHVKAADLAQIDAAKKDGRWTAAYDSPSNATFPEDFLAEWRKNQKARAFFESLHKASHYAIAYRLQTAKKPETRQRHVEMILAMVTIGEAFH